MTDGLRHLPCGQVVNSKPEACTPPVCKSLSFMYFGIIFNERNS